MSSTDTSRSDARPMIEGGSPTLFVADMQRSVNFYTQLLDLKILYRAGDDFVMIDAGRGFCIGLHPPSSSVPTPGTRGAMQLGFTVTRPIEEVVTALQQRGVEFETHAGRDGPIVDDGFVKLAFFGDPDGNSLYLFETKQG